MTKQSTTAGRTYLVISPVKDEERHVERTLESMVHQTLRPVRWVIVDDGSTDGTLGILERYAETCEFIQVVRKETGGERGPGSPVIRAFHLGYEKCRDIDHEFVVKLDCDLSFGPDYFETLVGRFQEDSQLGIASGIYREQRGSDDWVDVPMPDYHAAGAAKCLRRVCYEQIGGFIAAKGWDTVDEIRAMSKGWRTTHFKDLVMTHWKPEGRGIGLWRTNWMHGEIHYRAGGGFWFFVFKALHRVRQRPYVLGALSMVCGYLKAVFGGTPRLVSKEEARTYKHLLNARILTKLKLRRPAAATIR